MSLIVRTVFDSAPFAAYSHFRVCFPEAQRGLWVTKNLGCALGFRDPSRVGPGDAQGLTQRKPDTLNSLNLSCPSFRLRGVEV